MATKIQLRRGTAAQWVAANPVLAEGEIGVETDTKQFKIGDGLKEWTLLAYIATGNMDVASSNLDDLADGVDYKRIVAAKALKINGGTFSPDDLAEGSTYKKTTAAGAEAANSIGAISDAAGDLIVATGANSFKKLGLGVAGQVLQVNPGANDVEWASVNALSVTQVANLAALPNPGDANTLYRTADNGKLYRLAAAPNTYAEVPSSLALGELSTNAYRGDRGAELYTKKDYIPSSAEKGTLTKLNTVESYADLYDYQKAAKMPPALLREMVESASAGAATVIHDDLGFPSMMYVIRGPILAGHIHTDFGSVTALKTVAIAAAGTGYSANDILTIAGGTGGTVRVLTVGGSGEVTSIQIANPGTGYSAATGAATTGGTGSGCTITTTIAPVFPAYSVNGVEKNQIYISMFKGTTFNGSAYHGSGAGYRAVSWPGLIPTGSLAFNLAKDACTAKGAGWHMMTMWERALLMWLSMKMATEPRGNTYYGRSHKAGFEYECAVRSDGLAPGTASGTAKHRNGSGPSSWAHNKERWGIYDLVGSMSEWLDGFKIVDGLVKMPDDNYYSLLESSWPSQKVYFDNTTAGSGGAPRLSDILANVLTDPNSSSVAHGSLTMTAGYDALDLAIRQRMLMAGIAMKLTNGGALSFNPAPEGTLYHRNYGERLPLAGGDWDVGSYAGLAFLVLVVPRSSVGSDIGFRPAFISP